MESGRPLKRGLLSALKDEPNKYYLKGKSEKFSVPPSELDMEKFVKSITPQQSEKNAAIQAFIGREMERPGVTKERKAALQMWQTNLLRDEVDADIDKQFAIDFYYWLQGKGKKDDHINTAWKDKDVLYDKEVYDYVRIFLEAKIDFQQKLFKLSKAMELGVPKGIHEYYLYFKYIVRNSKDLDEASFLKDYNLFWSPVIDTKTGQNVMEKVKVPTVSDEQKAVIPLWPHEKPPLNPYKKGAEEKVKIESEVKQLEENVKPEEIKSPDVIVDIAKSEPQKIEPEPAVSTKESISLAKEDDEKDILERALQFEVDEGVKLRKQLKEEQEKVKQTIEDYKKQIEDLKNKPEPKVELPKEPNVEKKVEPRPEEPEVLGVPKTDKERLEEAEETIKKQKETEKKLRELIQKKKGEEPEGKMETETYPTEKIESIIQEGLKIKQEELQKSYDEYIQKKEEDYFNQIQELKKQQKNQQQMGGLNVDLRLKTLETAHKAELEEARLQFETDKKAAIDAAITEEREKFIKEQGEKLKEHGQFISSELTTIQQRKEAVEKSEKEIAENKKQLNKSFKEAYGLLAHLETELREKVGKEEKEKILKDFNAALQVAENQANAYTSNVKAQFNQAMEGVKLQEEKIKKRNEQLEAKEQELLLNEMELESYVPQEKLIESPDREQMMKETEQKLQQRAREKEILDQKVAEMTKLLEDRRKELQDIETRLLYQKERHQREQIEKEQREIEESKKESAKFVPGLVPKEKGEQALSMMEQIRQFQKQKEESSLGRQLRLKKEAEEKKEEEKEIGMVIDKPEISKEQKEEIARRQRIEGRYEQSEMRRQTTSQLAPKALIRPPRSLDSVIAEFHHNQRISDAEREQEMKEWQASQYYMNEGMKREFQDDMMKMLKRQLLDVGKGMVSESYALSKLDELTKHLYNLKAISPKTKKYKEEKLEARNALKKLIKKNLTKKSRDVEEFAEFLGITSEIM